MSHARKSFTIFGPRSLAMFEREDRFVAMEYDDCDVSVGETIDDHMRSIGFQVGASSDL